MQGPILRKYGVAATINFQLYAVDGVDFRVDAVHASGDTVIMKDEGAEANTTNAFTDEGNGYSLVLTATEMQAARIVVYVIDQTATKVWLDTAIVIDTYGNASAQHAIDLDDSVRAGLTALPNAAADAAGGLPISDAGGLDLDTLLSTLTNVTYGLSALDTDLGTLLTRLSSARAGYLDELAAANLPADIDTLIARLTAARAGYLDELGAANIPADIDTLIARLTAVRAGYLDNLNIGGNVASSAEATAIQNNTRVRVIVPQIMERPDSGSTLFKLHLYLYDSAGNMEAPDSAPTVTAENHSGTDRSANLGTVTLEATGHYSVTYSLASVDNIEQLLFIWTVTENAVARLHGGAAQVVDTTAVDFTSSDRTALNGIQTDLDNATDGLGALKTLIDAVSTKLGTPAGADMSVDINAIIADIAALNNISTADVLAQANAALTTAVTESYAAKGAAPSIVQALLWITQLLTELAISGTVGTVKQLDGIATAGTLTLNDPADPTEITRAT